MANIDRLVRHAKRVAKMRPVLPLGMPLALGSIGFLEDDAFRYWGTSDTLLGVPAVAAATGAPLPLVELQSGRDVQITALAKGETSKTFGHLAKGSARLEVSLGRSGSYVMAARDVRVKTLKEPHQLAVPMLRAYEQGLWDPDYIVVYEVGIAEAFTAVLAHEADTKVLVSTSVKVGSGKLEAGNLAAKLSFQSSTNSVEKLIGASKITAFFNAYRVHTDFWGRTTVRTAAARIPAEIPPARQMDQVELPKKIFVKI